MIFSDDFTKIRYASVFTMSPEEAIRKLGIQSTGSLKGDKNLLRGLTRKYHPDVTQEKDASSKMQAVNVLWETYIRNGKPFSTSTTYRQGPSSRPPGSERGETTEGLEEWLRENIPGIKDRMGAIVESLARVVSELRSGTNYRTTRVSGVIDSMSMEIREILGILQSKRYSREAVSEKIRDEFQGTINRLRYITANLRDTDYMETEELLGSLEMCIYFFRQINDMSIFQKYAKR